MLEKAQKSNKPEQNNLRQEEKISDKYVIIFYVKRSYTFRRKFLYIIIYIFVKFVFIHIYYLLLLKNENDK